MNAAEVTFLRAEGALRGWDMGGEPQALYEKAIALSFEERGATGADKYVKDALHLTRMWYKNKNVPYIRKKEIIGEWLKQSYIRKLKISDYQLHWKDRMLLHCLHMSCFIGINLIVNGKEYINSLSKE